MGIPGKLAYRTRTALVTAMLMVATTLSGPVFARASVTHTKPNIIVILVDDLGYADTSLYKGGRFKTPNIDRIAKQGVRFTAGYASAPVCAPSRAGLLTGRYQQRFGFEYNDGPARRTISKGLGLPSHELTMGTLLKRDGYHTGVIGKWHLGHLERFYPTNRGFDEFIGFLPGQSGYIDPRLPNVQLSYGPLGDKLLRMTNADQQVINALRDRLDLPDSVTDHQIRRRLSRIKRSFNRNRYQAIIEGPNRTPVDTHHEYLTDFWGDQAVDFIRRNAPKPKPYFLYLAFNAVHSPHMVTEAYYKRFADIKDHQLRVYAAMIAALDDQVGRVLDAVEASGQKDNTLIFLASDNGCEMYFPGLCSCHPLRGGKLSDYEGGFRIPFAARWPGKIKAGTVYRKPVSLLDVVPTSVAAAHSKLPTDRAYDGVDLLPYLSGKKSGEPHNVLFWRRAPLFAVRKGDWKLWESVEAKGPYGHYKLLFNLKTDPNETTNLASSHPAKVKELESMIHAWSKTKMHARWPSKKPATFNVCGRTFTLPI